MLTPITTWEVTGIGTLKHSLRDVGERHGHRLWRAVGMLAVLCLTLVASKPAFGQRREYPAQDYYLSFNFFEDGEFVRALKAFRASARSGIVTSEGRWVDSICYYTMMGECHFQMGDLPKALEYYTNALNLYLGHSMWMLRVEFPPALEPATSGPRRPITWGGAARRTALARYPLRYQILQGRPDNERVLQTGGVVALPEIYLINAHEIARCTALAIRRRHELMGEACRHDALTSRLIATLGARPAPPNHWTQAWVSVQLGLAYSAAGQSANAVAELNKGLTAGGGFEHHLSAMALLELGKLAFEQGQVSRAGSSFYEASVSAALFEQYDLIEEALRWGALAHIVTGQEGIYPPLSPAADWARRESTYLEASLLTHAARNAVELNQTAAAAGLESQARQRMARRDMLGGAAGARLDYAQALIQFQRGNLADGNAAFARLMSFQSRASLRLFEIQLVDRLYTSGTVTERVANELYARVLRDPQTKDWSLDPVETLSVVLTPHIPALEHWFESALKRREPELALDIADRIRRHRFYTTLPMGGRLLSLRWVLEAPQEALPNAVVLQRQNLMAAYPRYAQLATQSGEVNALLEKLPLAPEGDEARTTQARLLEQLRNISLTQEVVLREMALRRAPSEFIFPPRLDFKKLQGSLPPGKLVLSFLATSRYVYAFAVGHDSYSNWQLQAPAKIHEETVRLLREMGHVDKNLPIDAKQLADPRWKTTAASILRQLTNGAKPEVWETFDEVVVVPDGPLWYVPFEALQVPDRTGSVPLISKVRLRYAPTVSLALPDRRRLGPVAETAVVAGALFPRSAPEIAEAEMIDFREAVPRATRLHSPSRVPSGLLATQCDRVVVLADMEDSARGPYDWAPLPLDRGNTGDTLANWIALPWGGPQQVVLPGFHTAAEFGLKRGGGGNELFLAVCGLMASGSRTVLLSRWRTGGSSSYDLVREFVQELPYTSASDAWQRSVALARSDTLDLKREPRVDAPNVDTALSADHPFFWAGYLLVDTGFSPTGDDALAVAGAEKPAD